MKYEITIEEILSRTITVEADTKEEALRKIRKAYNDCSIVLDSDDHVETKIY